MARAPRVKGEVSGQRPLKFSVKGEQSCGVGEALSGCRVNEVLSGYERQGLMRLRNHRNWQNLPLDAKASL